MVLQKRLHAAIVCKLLVALLLAGCGSNGPKESGSASPAAVPTASEQGDETEGSKEQLPPVELTYYYVGTPQKDLPLVEAEMNKILKKKINATIKLKLIDWGSYDQKMNVMIAAGDEMDLMFTAPWSNNYYQNVEKNALLPLDDLLDKYAPRLKATVPAYVWDATRIRGKIYGAINWQIIAMQYGFDMREDLADKYGLDMDKVNKYDELEPFLDKLAAGEPGVTPLSYVNNYDIFNGQAPYFGMDTIGDDASPGWLYLDDSETRVINQYASPEYEQFVRLMHKWHEKGFFRKDNASITDNTADTKAGRYGGSLAATVAPGVESTVFLRFGVHKKFKALSPALVTTGRAIATMTGISATSKNPERAMMFLELINTDKELYNLLCHGIEGKHYVFVDKEKGVIGMPEGITPETNGYAPGTDWMFGNQFNGYYISEADVGNWEKTQQLNESAVRSPLLGFNFNPEPVKAELAQASTVIKQYHNSLVSGSVDPDKFLPEFLEKLKSAGADKVVAEKQKQIDAWKSAK
ncbi:ABC transporter substrate-binding protein [Cohnella rhizosphaerae]|uniref:ABC transporter substrate-binding protein n=1 Tax=Cohnella rhizosphaerae TaxID=1457232 RepID=A0A9X4QRA4_9BACL|nr:ABC transporter substrate-binding protein [Cohnella rhizosphaerae]MDG0808048.1 ABC transporter substrate-binding protein [Cohnella rhizosphaerae]